MPHGETCEACQAGKVYGVYECKTPRQPPLLLHATTADTQPKQDGPGGVWMVGCETCGWTQVGHYSGIMVDEVRALRYAHLAGTRHEDAMNGKRAGWSK